jgi:hypothetical protein
VARLTIGVEVLDDGGEALLGLLVEVGDGNASGEDGVVRVLRCEIGGGLGGEVVELDSGYARIHSSDDLLGDLNRLNMAHVEAVAELCDARGDLGGPSATQPALSKRLSPCQTERALSSIECQSRTRTQVARSTNPSVKDISTSRTRDATRRTHPSEYRDNNENKGDGQRCRALRELRTSFEDVCGHGGVDCRRWRRRRWW